LQQKLQDRFEDGPLTFYLIDPKVPERVRLDIFERVNLGVPLTRQQMRNAIYNGPATALLRELAQSEAFKDATCQSLSSDRLRRDMKDREAINRFLAHFTIGWEKFGSDKFPDYDEYLGKALRTLNKDPAGIEKAKIGFIRSMRLNTQIFGENAFRKSIALTRRSALNLALFDVLSVGLAKLPRTTLSNEQRIHY
jgi:hypothetical protein